MSQVLKPITNPLTDEKPCSLRRLKGFYYLNFQSFYIEWTNQTWFTVCNKTEGLWFVSECFNLKST
jgi:hypothetical protein